MSELQLTGVICQVSPIQEITSTFRKRGFVLDISFEYNGYDYEEYAVLQLVNGACDLLTENMQEQSLRFMVGDKVRVSFKLKGTKHKTKAEYYNNLNVYRIDAIQQDYTPHVPPVTYEQQMSNFNTQQGTGIANNSNPETIDDLPF